MKVFVDTNIILDVLLDREPFVADGIRLFKCIEAGRVQGLIAATTITNVFYILRKMLGRDEAIKAVERLLIGFEFCPVDRQVVEMAIANNLKDFEDGIQSACAAIAQAEVIVTRNVTDFAGVDLPVLSVTEMFDRYQLAEP